MDPDHARSQADRPSTVEALLLTALDRSGSYDARRIEALCAERPELADELRALAEHHARGCELFSALSQGPELDGRSASAEPAALRFSERYEVLGEIARGGMGVVLEVWDAKLRRKLAMKALRRDRDLLDPDQELHLERRRARLVNEAQVLAQLEHPGIVPVHDVGLDDSREIYFTMLRVRGQSLDRVFAAVRENRDGWNLTRAVSVLLRVSEAVAYAHEKGVLHRDLKPSNVMVGSFGETYVMDWGLARASTDRQRAPTQQREPAHPRSAGATQPGESLVRTNRSDERASDSSSPLLTQEGEVVGTPAYMSPEQARGSFEIDARSDVYSLGAMLYELLAGAAPYTTELRDSPPHAVLAASLQRAPMRSAEVARRAPAELTAICDKAMAREPARRYSSVSALAHDLRAYLEGRVVRAHRTGALIELRKWIVRNKGAATAIAAVLVGLASTATVQSLLKRDVEHAQLETAARAEALRRQGYVSSVALAATAMKEGKSGRMRELLERCPEDLRGWEWRFLAHRVDTSAWTIHLAPDRLRSVAFTPDGRGIVTSDAGTLALLDAETGNCMREIERFENEYVGAVSFSADGTRLVSMGDRGELRVWDTSSWKRLSSVAVQVPEWRPNAACSPVGDLVAVFGTGPAEIRDLSRGTLLGILDAGQDHVTACWSHDGERLYTGAWDGSLAVWDVPTSRLIQLAHEHGDRINHVSVSPDGRWLAAAGWERRVFVWDAKTFEPVHRTDFMLLGPLAWSPDSSLLAFAAESSIALLDAGTWMEQARLHGHDDLVCSLAFDTPGQRLVSTSVDGEVRTWDLQRSEHRAGIGSTRGNAQTPRFSRDGRWVVVNWNGLIELWSVPDRRCVRSLRFDGACIDLSPDASRMLARLDDRSVSIVDLRDGRALGTISDVRVGYGAFNPDALRFSPDGTRISIVGTDGSLSVWGTSAFDRRWTVQAYSGPSVFPWRLGGGCWSPDGKRIATLPAGGLVQVWDAERGELLHEWRARGPWSELAHFSPDGRRLFLARRTPTGLECWDVERAECLWDAGQESALALGVGDGGKRLFCVRDFALEVRDAATGNAIVTLNLDPFLEYGFAVSPVDDVVVTASKSGLQFWDTDRAESPP